MALPITDYTAFFAGAKQAVQGTGTIKRKGNSVWRKARRRWRTKLRTREKAVADTIARTVKARGEEIARSY